MSGLSVLRFRGVYFPKIQFPPLENPLLSLEVIYWFAEPAKKFLCVFRWIRENKWFLGKKYQKEWINFLFDVPFFTLHSSKIIPRGGEYNGEKYTPLLRIVLEPTCRRWTRNLSWIIRILQSSPGKSSFRSSGSNHRENWRLEKRQSDCRVVCSILNGTYKSFV